jgi:crotonobetaine/carnitine-CoA ligase
MTMGRPSPEYGIAVIRDDGTNVDPDETGQLLVRGVRGLSLFAEYLFDPDATASSFDAHGWFQTGDLVTPHDDGHITFADRAKDMLKVGAENVAASEIERVIMTTAGIQEAAVVGRPDDRLDEVPVAFIVASDRPGLTEKVVEQCRRMLADFKVPRAVYVVPELPRSTLRKVNKVELRAVAMPDADRAVASAQWLEAATRDPSSDATTDDNS